MECHAVRCDLNFRSNQFHSVVPAVRLCGMSFVKVIQISNSKASLAELPFVCLFILKQSEAPSLVCCVSLATANYKGSLQVQGQSEV